MISLTVVLTRFVYLNRIEDYCNNYAKQHAQPQFQIFDNLKPIVSTKQCFDDLRVEPTHVSRRPSDTYYIDPNTVSSWLRACWKWLSMLP